jgi:hypothetical protein
MKHALAILFLGAAVSLSAQETRFGVQGALSLPNNHLSDNAYLGMELGGHAQWDFHGGHGLMARADATFYSSNNGASVTGLALGADYTYHVDQRPTGFYLLAGLAQESFHTSFNTFSRNDSNLGVDAGAGYDFDRNLGCQLRYITHSVTGGTYSSLNLGVTYTF